MPSSPGNLSRTIAATTLLLAVSLLAAAAVAAQEPHFTLRVPVTLSDIHPDQQSFRVSCSLLPAGSDNALSWSGSMVHGTYGVASDAIPLGPTGSYTGPPIEIRITAPPDVSHEELLAADRYRCRLRLCDATGYCRGTGPMMQMSSLQPKSGTPFSGEVIGPIPQP
jgi:hypothetical protein